MQESKTWDPRQRHLEAIIWCKVPRWSIFTLKVFAWYGIPRLAFSAIMSLISITLAQVSLYKTRHGFDMTFLGQVSYTASTLIATFVKLSFHVIFYAIFLIYAIDQEIRTSSMASSCRTLKFSTFNPRSSSLWTGWWQRKKVDTVWTWTQPSFGQQLQTQVQN